MGKFRTSPPTVIYIYLFAGGTDVSQTHSAGLQLTFSIEPIGPRYQAVGKYT
jgi:hypothetical protein